MADELFAWDAASARDIDTATRRVLGRVAGPRGPQPRNAAAGVRAIVVQLDIDIPEDDAREYTARVMELHGNTWKKGNAVKVRSCGREIERDVRYIALPSADGLIVGGAS